MNVIDLYNKHIKKDIETKLLYQTYAKLTKDEIDLMIDTLITDTESDEDIKTDIILYLALFSYASGEYLPHRLYDYLLDNNIFYYGEMYLRADEKTAIKLIDILINKTNIKVLPENYVNHILCAISRIPCEASKNFLIESSKEPLPNWAKSLYILPIEYAAYVGGWCIDDEGNIQKLFSENVQAFQSCEKKSDSSEAPFKLLEERCDFCGRHLISMFDEKEKLATCPNCTFSFQTIFTKRENNKITWHNKNQLCDILVERPEQLSKDDISDETTKMMFDCDYILIPLKEKRNATYTAHQFAEISRTQIGGMPTAINDIKYPNCPDCGKKMHFYAQFAMEDVQEYGNGLYYFFVCNHCNTVACNYDQS